MRTKTLVVAVGETGHDRKQVLRQLTLGSSLRANLTVGRNAGRF